MNVCLCSGRNAANIGKFFGILLVSIEKGNNFEKAKFNSHETINNKENITFAKVSS